MMPANVGSTVHSRDGDAHIMLSATIGIPVSINRAQAFVHFIEYSIVVKVNPNIEVLRTSANRIKQRRVLGEGVFVPPSLYTKQFDTKSIRRIAE